jgi:hypothetical protein
MKRAMLFLIALSVLFLFSAQSSAAYYKWLDEKGKVWITDYPNPKYDSKKAAAAKSPYRDEKQELPISFTENQVEKKRESSPGFIIPEDIRKRIAAVARNANMPEISDSMIGIVAGFALAGVSIFYLYFCMCLFFIARKLALPNAWYAWVPVMNLYIFVTAAGKPGWWMVIIVVLLVLMMIPVVGIVFGLVITVLFTYLWMCITQNIGKNRWLGILMLVPVVMIVFPAFLAFSKDQMFLETGDSYSSEVARRVSLSGR